MKEAEVTFVYCVGGDDVYYDCLYKSIESLTRINEPYNILVLDVDAKFSLSIDKVKRYKNLNKVKGVPATVNDREVNHFQFLRYQAYKHVETKYAFYLDVDVVINKDRLNYLKEKAGDKFLIAQHWWVPNIRTYTNKTKVYNSPTGKKYINYLHKDLDRPYIASGVFFYQPELHGEILEEVNTKFKHIYSQDDAHITKKIGITDECVLSSCLTDENSILVNGAFNHCANTQWMPLKIENGELYGKNPYNKEFEPVVCLHADIDRRIKQFGGFPHKHENKEVTDLIKKGFYL